MCNKGSRKTYDSKESPFIEELRQVSRNFGYSAAGESTVEEKTDKYVKTEGDFYQETAMVRLQNVVLIEESQVAEENEKEFLKKMQILHDRIQKKDEEAKLKEGGGLQKLRKFHKEKQNHTENNNDTIEDKEINQIIKGFTGEIERLKRRISILINN